MGAMPIPPATRSGRRTSRSKPLPSGPKTWIASPRPSAQRARVPGPIGSTRNWSSPDTARHRLIGRGSTRRSLEHEELSGNTRLEIPSLEPDEPVGPICSTPIARNRSRRAFTPRSRCAPAATAPTRLSHSRSHARPPPRRDRGHTRHACDERGLTDEIAVGARTASLRRVDDEIATPAAHEVDHGLVVVVCVGDLAISSIERPAARSVRAVPSVATARSRARRAPPRRPPRRACPRRERTGTRCPTSKRSTGGSLGLRKRGREIGGARHDLARRAHLRPEHGIGSRKARER